MEEAGQGVNQDRAKNTVSVELDYDRTVNYAMQQNDVPLIKTLRIVNGTDRALRDLLVRITTEPAFAAPWESLVAAIGPRDSFNLGVVDLPLAHDFLANCE